MTDDRSRPLYIAYAGPNLLELPLLNKGSAFSQQERLDFNLIGLLPQNVERIEEQVERAYAQYRTCDTDLERHIYLRGIQDDNETLFFRMLEEHLEEMLPIIYTPTVGEACQKFSDIYRSHRGLFVSYPDRHYMDDILRSVTKDKVKVIVVTDGERILGLGDQGIGGMGIPIGKLSLYSACGGISPAYTLPVVLDVGTNNRELLDDPMYMGWRHERIDDDAYAEFVDLFVSAVQRRWPNTLLQFEDFAQRNAMPLLRRYRDRLCCFNDDIQGTAAVVVGSLLAACKAKSQSIAEQTIVFMGAGSAGCGIAEQIVVAMQAAGLSEAAARARVYMIDRNGLITDAMSGLPEFQQRLAQPADRIAAWERDPTDAPLLTVVGEATPTVLIGACGQPGIFSRAVIERMQAGCAAPIVLPLSNPTSHAEATPAQILEWSGGRALVATGSPFGPVTVDGREVAIAQCNNAYIFPGLGLGVVASGAKRITDAMFMAASEALAQNSPLGIHGEGALLPPLSQVRELSQSIAYAVGRQAQHDGVALKSSAEGLRNSVLRHFWFPRYRRYRRAAF